MTAAKKLLSDELIEERLEEQRRENEQDAAQGHEWDGSYPYSKCKRCAALDLGGASRTPCRGWYFGEDGEKVYVEASRV